MQKLTNVAAIAVSALLAGCGSTKLPTLNFNRAAPVAPPVVNPMTFTQINWEVYDLSKLKQLVARLEASGQTQIVIYVLTQDGYEALAGNLSEMKRYISDQKAANEFLVKSLVINGKETPKAKAETKSK